MSTCIGLSFRLFKNAVSLLCLEEDVHRLLLGLLCLSSSSLLFKLYRFSVCLQTKEARDNCQNTAVETNVCQHRVLLGQHSPVVSKLSAGVPVLRFRICTLMIISYLHPYSNRTTICSSFRVDPRYPHAPRCTRLALLHTPIPLIFNTDVPKRIKIPHVPNMIPTMPRANAALYTLLHVE